MIVELADGRMFDVDYDKAQTMLDRIPGAKLMPGEEITPAESAGTAATRFATLGFDDYAAGIGGGLGSAYQRLKDSPDDEGAIDAWRGALSDAREAFVEARDERRQDVEDAYKANPNAYRAGALAGSIATAPLAAGRAALSGSALKQAAQAAKRAAPLGAVQAAGLGDKDTLTGAGLDAAIGALLTGGISASAPLAKKVPAKLAKKLEEFGENADELRVLTTMGATGGSVAAPAVLREVKKVPGGMPEVARVLRETGISKGFATTGGIAKRAGQKFEESGQKIGAILDDFEQRGAQVDAMDLAGRLRRQANDAVQGMKGVSDVSRQHADKLNQLADRIEDASAETAGFVSPSTIKQLSSQLGTDATEAYRARAAGRSTTGTGQALMDARRSVEDALGDMMRLSGESPAAYTQAKRLNQVSRLAKDAAELSRGRANKRNLIGLTTATLAQTGPLKAAAYAITKPLHASGRATAAERAKQLAETLQRSTIGGPAGDVAARTTTAALSAGRKAATNDDVRITKKDAMQGAQTIAGLQQIAQSGGVEAAEAQRILQNPAIKAALGAPEVQAAKVDSDTLKRIKETLQEAAKQRAGQMRDDALSPLMQ